MFSLSNVCGVAGHREGAGAEGPRTADRQPDRRGQRGAGTGRWHAGGGPGPAWAGQRRCGQTGGRVMRLFDEFAEEHQLVDRASGSLVRFAERARQIRDDPRGCARFRAIFQGVHRRLSPRARGEGAVSGAGRACRGARPTAGRFRSCWPTTASRRLWWTNSKRRPKTPLLPPCVARRLAHHLWEHADKEDSVLFPESQQRLIRGGVADLEGRPPTPEEEAARGARRRASS